MAVTECVIDFKGVTGTLSARPSESSISERFRIALDAGSRDLPTIMQQANALNPDFPLRGYPWPLRPTYGLYARTFQFEPMSDLLKNWHVTVNYLPREASEPNVSAGNPLLWPPTYSADWVEYEEAVTEAYNVEAFLGGPGRAALTLGPVVNTAYQEFDEGLFRTVREMVLNIHKNLPSLDAVAALNYDYQDTTNSDTYKGQAVRRWEFLGAVSPGIQNLEGVDYWPTTISIHLKKTTDRKINNVGWKNLNFDGDVVPYKIEANDPSTGALVDVSEPGFLNMSGGRAPTTPLAVTYRYLTAVPYAPLG